MDEQTFYTIGINKSLIDEKKLTISGIVGSTGTIDRHGDSVNPEGWHLQNFMKNPVIMYGHDYRSLPIGKATKVWVQDSKLMFDIAFATTKYAKEVFELIKQDIINAFSVGFIVKRWGSDEEPYTIMEQELLELSVVPIPANPEALKAKGIEKDELIEKVQKLYELLDKAQEEAEGTDEPDEPDQPDDKEPKDTKDIEPDETPEKEEDDEVDEEVPDNEEKKKVLVIDVKDLKDIIRETLKDVISDYKLVEEKLIDKVEEKSTEANDEVLDALVKIRQLVVKSDSHIGSALKSLKSIINVHGKEVKK